MSHLGHLAQYVKQTLAIVAELPAKDLPARGLPATELASLGQYVKETLAIVARLPRKYSVCDLAVSFKRNGNHGLVEQDLVVYSQEYDHTGKRIFFVDLMTSFAATVAAQEPQRKHFYEVLCGGAPVFLFFDLE